MHPAVRTRRLCLLDRYIIQLHEPLFTVQAEGDKRLLGERLKMRDEGLQRYRLRIPENQVSPPLWTSVIE